MANNKYDQIMTDRGGYARVRIGDKWGAINAQEEIDFEGQISAYKKQVEQ